MRGGKKKGEKQREKKEERERNQKKLYQQKNSVIFLFMYFRIIFGPCHSPPCLSIDTTLRLCIMDGNNPENILALLPLLPRLQAIPPRSRTPVIGPRVFANQDLEFD